MTEISFHFNVPDRTGYACRLLRKASRQGARVVVAAPAVTLRELDRALWSFEPVEFVAHVLVKPGQAVPPRLQATPVWLAEAVAEVVHRDVLLNLGDEPPLGFESFARLIEIVTTDEDDRANARRRWKHYASRGYALQRHEVAA